MLSKKKMTRKPSILKATFGQFVGFWFFWIQKIAHYWAESFEINGFGNIVAESSFDAFIENIGHDVCG